MNKIINKELIKINQKKLIISSIIVSVLMFFIMGNNNMINVTNEEVMSGIIFNKCFSLSYFKMFILFILSGVLYFVFSKEKLIELQNIIDKKVNRLEYLIRKTILVNIPIIIAIFINLLLKFILYFSNKDIFVEQLTIEFNVIFSFIAYVITISFLFYSIILLFNIAIKDHFMATIIPLFTFDGFILIFGISTLFLSDKLSFIKTLMEPISSFIIDILDLLYFNIRLENKDTKVQLFVLMVMIAVSFLILYIAYVMIGLLKKKSLKNPYFFELFRYVFYAVISILIGFYSISGIGFLILFLGEKYTFNEGALYINIISLIAIGIIYAILESLYRYKLKNIYNDLDKEDHNKRHKDNSTESNGQADIVEDENLSLINKMKDFFKDIKNNEEINKEINEENKISLDDTSIIDTQNVRKTLYNMDHTMLLNENLNEYDNDSDIIKKFNSEFKDNKENSNSYQQSSKDIEKYFTLSILNEKDNLNNEEDEMLKNDCYQISFADLQLDSKEDNFINDNVEFQVDENEQFNFLSILNEDK